MKNVKVVEEIQVRRRRIVQAPLVPTIVKSVVGGANRHETEEGECPPWEEKRLIDQPSQLPLCNQRYIIAIFSIAFLKCVVVIIRLSFAPQYIQSSFVLPHAFHVCDTPSLSDSLSSVTSALCLPATMKNLIFQMDFSYRLYRLI